jgi:8-oxo-dGTP diphosphatase
MAGIIPLTVCAVVRDGRMLFIRRKKFPFEGLLSMPGGKIEFGETLEQAAARELEEETGIRSRFLRQIATIPEHIVENGRVIGHLMIQLCELEYVEEVAEREFEPVWIDIERLDSLRDEITPSDYLMIKRLIVPGSSRNFYSMIEKTGSGYVQREFREI